MQIIVNSKREQEIITLFTEFVSDWFDSNQMKDILKHAGYEFKPHELELIQTGVYYANIKVDKKEHPVYLQSDNLTGQCKYCGGLWQGIEDEHEVEVGEYERLLFSPPEDSYHAECLREHTCQNCSNVVESLDELKEVENEMVCVDCE